MLVFVASAIIIPLPSAAAVRTLCPPIWLAAPVPRSSLGYAVCVSKLSCHIDPVPGSTPDAGSGDAENKMAFADAAM